MESSRGALAPVAHLSRLPRPPSLVRSLLRCSLLSQHDMVPFAAWASENLRFDQKENLHMTKPSQPRTIQSESHAAA